MSESEDGSILGGSGPLEMNIVSLPKMDAAQLDQLGLNEAAGALGTSLTSLGAASQHYVPVSSGSTQTLLEGVIAQGSRALSNVSPAVTFTTAGNSAQDSYGSLEYVTQMPLQDDQQGKFQDTLVAVNNVAFVEMSDAAMKGATSSAPLELYFDVMNPTTTAAPTTSSVHHVRHEHQNPKTQLLERAYSDILFQQQEEQQQQQAQEQEQPNHIMSDVSTNLVQLDHDGLPHVLHEYRKPNKLEIQKRQLQQHLQQQQQQQRQLQHQQQHQEQQQHQQRQLQLPHRLQQQPKAFQFQQPQQRQVQQQQQVHQQQQKHQHHQQQQQQQQTQLQHQQKQFLQQITKTHDQNNQDGQEQQQQQIAIQHMPLVSRSGRPIRRRPEYMEYVSQNLKEEEILPQLPEQLVKVETMVISADYEEEDPMEEALEDDDPMDEEIDSNDEDPETSGNYTTDGKKSLPHKKRIPKKLKTTKKHVKCYKCTQCGDQFTNQQQFAAHKQTHTPPALKPKPFKCEICAKAFDSQLKFFEHLKGHYEPYKKHKCEVCGGEFESAEALQEHSLVHSREHFTCELCNKTFRKESMLEVHLKVAHMEETETNPIDKPYSCVACPKSYRTQMALDSHVQSEHSENPPEFNCEDCYRVFKSKTKLLTHRKTEHKEEPQNKGAPKKKIKIGKAVKGGYACTMCPRVFTHKNSLVYHIRGHTGERPHQCEQCGKAFYAASALKVHQRLHSGEKPYKCQLCEKFFRQWGDLRYHTTSVHSDDRQYQCEYCGKDFKRKYCLVVHRRIHTGEKNYKCEHCNKAFRAASYLQNHKRIHTGERPHACPDCGKPFRVRSDMKRHRQTHMREAGITGSGVATPASSHVNQGGTQTPVPPIPGQIVPGTITQVTPQPQLILSDEVSVPGSTTHPIRIMVSSINGQQVAAVHPPPAHRQSQHVTVPVSGSIATITTGPVSPGGTTTTLSPEVIIMDDNTHQPINLNIIPRMMTQEQVASSPHGSHATLVTTDEEYQLTSSGRNALEVRGEEGSVYVWHGVFTN
ncbi:uncharacterized protein [Procambarus clarkii]|uniref:uncharacterized protein n=1 Tax=Procambarus clarkii TaxID=6728 RepID=UPI001E67441F|nr:zinc finger and SCAN domain-containing protein 12-like [Procambarus clarkii]